MTNKHNDAHALAMSQIIAHNDTKNHTQWHIHTMTLTHIITQWQHKHANNKTYNDTPHTYTHKHTITTQTHKQ